MATYRPMEPPDAEILAVLVAMEARVAQHHGDEARQARLSVRAALGVEVAETGDSYRLVLDGIPLEAVPRDQVTNAVVRLRRRRGDGT